MDVTGAYTEVFIRWLDCVDRGVRPQIHGDGSATMDFIYVDDIARANILAMQSDRRMMSTTSPAGPRPRCWVCGSDPGSDRGTHLEPEFHPPRKVNPVPRRLADIRRARDELGFVAEFA